MAKIEKNKAEQIVKEFLNGSWSKTVAWLKNRFNLSREDAEDIVEESIIDMYNTLNIKPEKEIYNINRYLKEICRNKAIALGKKAGSYKNTEYYDSSEYPILALCDKHLGTYNDIDEKEFIEIFMRAISNLGGNCQIILTMMLEGMKAQEINNYLITYLNYKNGNTVAATKSQCKKKFEEALKNYDISFPKN